ncbi:MAG: hypothetical protein M5U28_16180 [Sandaracinaceae bacterium]|nr:hypothetical protein [Sandaracinaceae bacterium]
MTPAVRAGDLFAGRFEIEELRGRGGAGAVYRAFDRERAERVALKVLSPHAGEERYLAEASALEALSHPGIVRALGHGVEGGGARWLALEWIEGLPSPRGSRPGGWPPPRRWSWRAAPPAPSRRRTPRASCTAISRPGTCSCRAARSSRRRSSTSGSRARWPGSPGRARASSARPATWRPSKRAPRTTSTRARTCSRSAASSSSAWRAAPFEAGHALALLAKIVFDEVPRLDALREDVPASLASLVARALAKSREERPADGAALLALLDGVAADARPEPASGGERRVVAVVLARTPRGARAREVVHALRRSRRWPRCRSTSWPTAP